MKIKKCVICEKNLLKTVFSLGKQPLANNLSNYKDEKVKLYDLKINLCKRCFHCQLTEAVSPKKLFSKYLYKSSISKTFKNHFKYSCQKYIKQFNLQKKKSMIIDIGSNDGIALLPFKNYKFKNLIGIEPAYELAKITRNMKIKTYNSFLNENIANKLKNRGDLITASNVFAHVKDINKFTKYIFEILKINGVLIIEVQYLYKMLLDGSFDNIYHEHLYYWSVNSLKKFFLKFNAEIFHVEEINTHGGSIRIYVKNKNNFNIKINKSVKNIIQNEKNKKIFSLKAYYKFGLNIIKRKKKLINRLNKFKNRKKIIGYGAPAKATTLINYFKLKKYISSIIDDNPMKNNKYIPNTNINISTKTRSKAECVVVFAWNYFDEIKKNNKKLGKIFINIFNP